MSRAPRGRLPSLFRDERGVSAVEFALLAPVLIVLYFGMVEFCQGYMAQKRASHVASMVADLVAQSNTALKAAQIDEIFPLGDIVMQPFDTGALQQRVSSVTRVTATKYTVNWSRTTNGRSKLKATEVVVPTALLTDGQSVIIGESWYTYESMFKYLIPDALEFHRTAYLRPRVLDAIPCTDC